MSRQAKELSIDSIIDDVGGGMVTPTSYVKASEPEGEGAVDCNVVGSNTVDNGGGRDHFVEISKFWIGFCAGNDFLGVALVESIDKGSIFRLDYSTIR